ncbi:MAG: YlxM family DNA-binding protein [Lachnospiraceae bacterium]
MIAQVMEVDEILEQTLLFDFYGELLTEHQKEIYGQFITEDLSLGEIAEEAGISRQGVHDLVRRCSQTLKGYEEKLHLIERFLAVKEKVESIDRLLDDYNEENAGELLRSIRRISGEIIEEL